MFTWCQTWRLIHPSRLMRLRYPMNSPLPSLINLQAFESPGSSIAGLFVRFHRSRTRDRPWERREAARKDGLKNSCDGTEENCSVRANNTRTMTFKSRFSKISMRNRFIGASQHENVVHSDYLHATALETCALISFLVSVHQLLGLPLCNHIFDQTPVIYSCILPSEYAKYSHQSSSPLRAFDQTASSVEDRNGPHQKSRYSNLMSLITFLIILHETLISLHREYLRSLRIIWSIDHKTVYQLIVAMASPSSCPKDHPKGSKLRNTVKKITDSKSSSRWMQLWSVRSRAVFSTPARSLVHGESLL